MSTNSVSTVFWLVAGVSVVFLILILSGRKKSASAAQTEEGA